MKNKYLPVHPSKGKAFILIGLVLFLYLLDNLPIGSFINYMTYSNLIKPILWFSLTGLVWVFPRVRSRAPLKLKVNLNWWAFNFAVIFIIISVIAGFIDGFGKSPYVHSAAGTLINILVVGSALVGREAARCYVVNNLTKSENFIVFIPIALLMTLSNFTIDRFTGLSDMESIVELLAQYLVPEFLQSLLATYLAFLGGVIPAIIYMSIIQAFNWLSPILPNLKWITAALVGIICPAYSLAAMQTIYLNETKVLKKTDKDKEGLGGWIITSLVSIGIIWFSVGVFPIYPSVIATGSMEPMIKPGDVILVEKILQMEDIKQLKVGDVIQFTRGSILISHRIIEVVNDDEEIRYRTKGDNNSSQDIELVKPEDVKGSIRCIVPKIGWPTLIIKQEKNLTVEKVEF